MTRRRVVITGMGIIAPTGLGIEPLWCALVEGRSSVARISAFDTSSYPSQIAAECVSFDPLEYLPASRAKRLGRFCQMAIASAQLALADAGLAPGSDGLGPRTGIFIGTACGASHIIEEQFAIFREKGYRRVHPMLAPMASPQAAASQIAADLAATGPILTVSSDCPAGIDAIAWAVREISSGSLDRAVAGGVDTPITPLLMIAFNRTGALSQRNDDPEHASRPFDRGRDGFVLGESAGLFMLESLEAARERGARPYGEVLGIGWGTDPSSEFGRAVEPGGFAAAMRSALQAANSRPNDIDFVCAHGPAIPATDLAEACAISTLFGTRERSLPVTSIKGAVGQPLAGGSALQVGVGLQALARQQVPPTVNCEELDPACTVDVVRTMPREQSMRTVLINTHGFGGNNSALILGTITP